MTYLSGSLLMKLLLLNAVRFFHSAHKGLSQLITVTTVRDVLDNTVGRQHVQEVGGHRFST